MPKPFQKDPSSALSVTLRATGKNQAQLAQLLGITTQAVGRWHKDGIPEGRVLQLELITGVSRHVLRPDLYPLPAGAVVQFVEQGEAA
jgi:DNA-binding transcriptional regulator YdaS (Cro superfamily)